MRFPKPCTTSKNVNSERKKSSRPSSMECVEYGGLGSSVHGVMICNSALGAIHKPRVQLSGGGY